MKKFKLYFILFACVLMFGSTTAQSKTLNIVTEKEWPPYAFEDNGTVKGYAIEVLSPVLKKMGVDFQVKAYPWAKSENMALTGKADAVFCASRKTKRETACYYPFESLFDSSYAFFIKAEDKGRLKYNSFEDLKSHKIGITRAYSYTEDFLNFVKENKNFTQANNDRLNLRRLAKGKIDYFPGEIGNIMMLLKEENLTGKIIALPKTLTQKPYYIIFNKQKVEKEFVDSFSQALKEFKNTPEFKEIFSKYFGN